MKIFQQTYISNSPNLLHINYVFYFAQYKCPEFTKNLVDHSALRNTFLRFSVVPEDLELTTIDVDIFSSLVV